jgi:hypothetical protein
MQGLPNEGRRGSRELDVQFYLRRYGDLQAAFGTNYTAAIDHWLVQGLPNEGRCGAKSRYPVERDGEGSKEGTRDVARGLCS